MSIKLTDTQLLTLSAAAQREDRCIAAPPSLKGAAAQKIAAKLVAAGLVEEIKAKPGAHVWRRDDATGAGLRAEIDRRWVEGDQGRRSRSRRSSPPRSRQRLPAKARGSIKDHDGGAGSVAPPTVIAAPREGSKLAAVVGLLRREGGATIDQLAAAMGWLPHTTRAALTGLRKRGFCDRTARGERRARRRLCHRRWPERSARVKAPCARHCARVRWSTAPRPHAEPAAASVSDEDPYDRHGSRSGTRRAGASFSRRPAPSLAEPLGPACAGPSLSRSSLSRHGLSPSGRGVRRS